MPTATMSQEGRKKKDKENFTEDNEGNEGFSTVSVA
jgi:hypothetical protein